ncbi:MAG: 30S ribosomal protein S11 [Patescibacteria group bacterium]|nr:30S ribosomal protein S11 [Patescibacteria group bacterium]
MRVKQAEGEKGAAGKAVTPVKRFRKKVAEGNFYIQSTFNNTIVSLTDKKGNLLFWSSAGKVGFRGAKQGTPYAASVVANSVAEAGKNAGLQSAVIFIKGLGQGRDQALRTIVSAGFEIIEIKDTTPAPHNGPRAKKIRRV